MLKEVYFDVYCNKCVHELKPENEEPCWECLTSPVNAYSHKPVKFEEVINDNNSSRKNG